MEQQEQSKIHDCQVKTEVEGFDKQKLRKTRTEEKNPLPTQMDIDTEKSEASVPQTSSS